MKKIFFGLALLALAGCATVKETYAPDGRKSYTLNCSGAARGWDKCEAAAGEICQTKGYDVISRNEANTSAVGGTRDGIFGSKNQYQSVLAPCSSFSKIDMN
jgi:hypothetical protein